MKTNAGAVKKKKTKKKKKSQPKKIKIKKKTNVGGEKNILRRVAFFIPTNILSY
ncbi:hypothetical protein [Treponema sp. R6D11]